MIKGNIETSFNEDGRLDEIFFRDSNGECIFHLEQMGDNHYWMMLNGTEEDLVLNIGSATDIDIETDWWESRNESDDQCAKEVTSLINKYGVVALINTIVGIHKSNDKCFNKEILMKDLLETKEKFLIGET